jgi:hypothetical protein
MGALGRISGVFVFNHHQYALYEATHENFVTFMIGALPYLWFLTFGAMAYLAVYNIRHTKHGYRYPLWQIFFSSFALSVVGGAVLHEFGMGYSVDHLLGARMPMYESEEKLETQIWQNPQEGRLLGRVTTNIEPPASTAEFTDVDGEAWKLDVTDLTKKEQELLQHEKHVKLIGVVPNIEERVFHSCGAFPWLLDKPMSRADFKAAREAFEMKIHSYEERIEEKTKRVDSDNLDDKVEQKDGPCRDIAPVKRMDRRVPAGEM